MVQCRKKNGWRIQQCGFESLKPSKMFQPMRSPAEDKERAATDYKQMQEQQVPFSYILAQSSVKHKFIWSAAWLMPEH